MLSAVPVRAIVLDEPKVRLVDERRRFKRVRRSLARHLRPREPAKFVVHDRQELRRRTAIAVIDRFYQPRDLAHDPA
jgi:hypothetical protein